MAFLASLLAQQGGAAQGRTDAYRDRIAQAADLARQQQQQAQFDAAQAQQASEFATEQTGLSADRAERNRLTQAQIDAQNNANRLTATEKGLDPATGLPRPFHASAGITKPTGKNGAAPSADQLFSYYLQLAQDATDQGNDAAAAKYTALANAASLGLTRTATAAYTSGAKTDLTKAQAAYWHDKPAEFKAQLQARLQTANAAVKARVQAAYISAGAAAARQTNSIDERESIALMSALNVANGKSEDQAFSMAMNQYHAANQRWMAQQSQYDKTGVAPAGFDPANPPQPQQFIVNTPAAAPSMVNVQVTLPDGTKKTVPVINRQQPQVAKTGGPASNDPLAPLIAQVKQERSGGKSAVDVMKDARSGGATDDNIRRVMTSAGYSAQEIDHAMSLHHLGNFTLPF